MSAEDDLAAALLPAFRGEFAGRDATARQLAQLILDAVDAALPLTRHEPSEPALAELELLAPETDVFAWEGAPGWDVVLARGLRKRGRTPPGPAVLDGLGARADRTQQRGELKRRAHAEAETLLSLAREAAQGASAESVVAAHASILRLVSLACVAPLLSAEPTEAQPLPPARLQDLLRDLDARGETFALAHEEWLARLLAQNPAAADAPTFRTFYAGLSQSLRVAQALRTFGDEAAAGRLAADGEALLGALGTWQPVRWSALRAGVPSEWMTALCPTPPAGEDPLARLARECRAALELFSRLWFAQGLPVNGFTALAALFTARCASAAALWEELGGGAVAV